MMREVVAARPDSARAHYVYAELLAHGRQARRRPPTKRAAARTIDPDVKFTDPEKFRTFEAALLRAQSPAAAHGRRLPAPARSVARTGRRRAPTRVALAPAAEPPCPGWVWKPAGPRR